MNPSANGWLLKCLNRTLTSDFLNLSDNQFYERLRSSGFIYGSSQNAIIPLSSVLKYTQEELAKINLCTALVFVDYSIFKDNSAEIILGRLLSFYETMPNGDEFLKSIFKFKTTPEQNLERLIHKRVQTNEGLIQKNFSHLVTNALLFTDVIAYKTSKAQGEDANLFTKKLESLIVQIVLEALSKKSSKVGYEHLILKLLKRSLRYEHTFSGQFSEKKLIDFGKDTENFRNLYLFDIACMSIYSDEAIEKKELDFMTNLGASLGLRAKQTDDSIEFLLNFVAQYRKNIAYFHFSNPLHHFYKRNQRAVKLLLSRNKNRLYKEIIQSKELVYLLSQSTRRELTSEEKQKVKAQLYDIFKSIPSLAIFVLPGGSVLLPIIIKFIPQLLPSAFNENKITDE